ncbi:putative membrane protein [[Clostridium] sordellii ATCC 9714]|nr:putative membrane protein [[Clostridium] sordellii ATCC 9714] [Paeniclostridium sordellii ATCC 9714]
MFNNWNLKKHMLISVIISCLAGLSILFHSKSSLGAIQGLDGGPNAFIFLMIFTTAILITILTFVLSLISYKLIKN